MFRNREFKQLIYISILVIIIEIFMALIIGDIIYIGAHTGKSVYIAGSIMIIVGYVVYVIAFTVKRYKKISKFSGWLFKLQGNDSDTISSYVEELKKLNDGEVRFDEYTEGELSILQNEIHKVTVRMIELNQRLLMDKTYLADTLADISHQLKTPMTSMMVMSDLLNDGQLSDEKREEFTRNIQNQLGRMEWLLTTLLRMSKLDAGTMKLNIEQVEAKGLIEKSVQHLLIPIELKNQTISIGRDDNDKDSPLLLNVDENWTVEAISNIVKNCMEHTGEGGMISISYGKNPLYSYITIKDNGAGINEQDLPHIFERFYKGKNAGKDSVGIGLAFAKQIINMENGTIEVTSREEEGSSFLIKFYR